MISLGWLSRQGNQMSTHDVRTPETDAERDALADVLSEAFNSGADAPSFLERAGHENLRVICTTDGTVAGGLACVPMGQFFGGRSVPMLGIAAVGVAPEHRSGGVARQLMDSIVRESAHTGFPISALYPATQTLYRRSGYEQAGSLNKFEIPTAGINVHDRDLPIELIIEEHEAEIAATYRERARRSNGNLDRGEYIWRRIRKFRNTTDARGYLARNPDTGACEAYMYLVKVDSPDAAYDVRATDFVSLTGRGGRRLWSLLSEFRSMAGKVIMLTSTCDPAIMILPENPYKIHIDCHWMIRIADVPAALEARGYPTPIDESVHLEVFGDEAIDANNDRFVLHVKDGHGSVERGGEGTLRTHIRGLAPMYASHRTATEMLGTDLVECDDVAALDSTNIVFSGPDSWMPDMF